ncbi:hypothetical protein HETIRDRAFT_323901 [Heterobasidion irregulare TC 32-1]|uniref:Uncharacterized protein n=1 Tax=Heterobasidion irregulare (strain TC 32-1) TaxID=747525 RepID=W4K0C5_HETIT|nr:uncharacterized protein HETIRDRAFT_323901 [Heterobasidion irregulare TC 32-1]ETW79247.1 hypothetical protein HETIRDRAFT_323901 [Heterobasidion irregulare TC 32-1]
MTLWPYFIRFASRFCLCLHIIISLRVPPPPPLSWLPIIHHLRPLLRSNGWVVRLITVVMHTPLLPTPTPSPCYLLLVGLLARRWSVGSRHHHHPRSMHFGMPYSTTFPASITRHTYNLIVNVRASHYLVLLFSGVVPLLVYLF